MRPDLEQYITFTFQIRSILTSYCSQDGHTLLMGDFKDINPTCIDDYLTKKSSFYENSDFLNWYFRSS